jgi:PAS domain S-box-containing protein
MQDKAKQQALRIGLIYGLAAAGWILISDQVVARLLPDAQRGANLQTYKGLGFVLATSLLLYVILRVFLRQREAEMAGRKQAQVALTGQKQILEMIARDAPLPKTLEALLRLTEAQSPEMFSSILLLDDTGRLRHGAAPRLPAEFLQSFDGLHIGPKMGSCGTAAFRREPVIVEDIASSPLWVGATDQPAQHGLRACWSTPIFDEQQRVLGTFAIYFRTPTRPTPQQEDLIQAGTHLAAIAIIRQRTHAALVKSEQRYRNLTDQAADSFFVHDERGKLVEVNRRACDSLGYTREELLQMSFTDVEQEFDPPALEKVLRQLKPGQARTLVGSHRRKNGTEFPVEVRMGSFESEGRQLFHSLARDITDRKRAADALEMFRTLVDRVNDAIEVIDPETGRFLDINEKACTDLDYPREELLSLNYTDVDPLMDLAAFKRNKEKLWESGALLVESTHRRRDGTTFPVEVNMKWVWLDRDYIVAVVRDITERRKNEEALRSSEERLRACIDNTPNVAVQWYDEVGRILFWNGASETIFGWKSEEVLGQKLDQIGFTSALAHEFLQTLASVGRSGKPVGPSEFEFKRRDGRPGVCLSTVFAIPAPDGRKQFVCMDVDLTERKQAEEALRRSEHQYSDLVNNIDGIVWEGDAVTLAMTFVSPQAERILGYPLRDWTSDARFWENHLRPDDRERVVTTFRESAQKGLAYDLEYCMIAADGREVWIHDFVTAVLEGGQPVTLRGVMVDVTERKKAEAELRRREERFRLLIENASDIVTVINAEGVIRFQSPSVARILGYQPEEMTNHSAFEFLYPDDTARIAAAIQRALANPGLSVTVEYRYRHADGSWRYLQSVGRSIAGEAPEGFVIVNSRDLTETRKLEEQFRQSQKMEAIGQLAGGVAHDLNNILTVVHMQLDLLKHGDPLSASQLESVLDIEKASRRAADLTRQLLMFSRRQAALKHDLDLNAVVTNITKMLQRILGEDVAMQISYAPQPLPVHADAGMLEQILLNLAVNSRDAMPQGGRLIIETAVVAIDELAAAQKPLARQGKFACLIVSDSGSGIPPEVLPRIFEPFFTTKDVGKGTGLGLATVFGIVQQHHGWINAYSEVGKGTTFRMYLPLQGASAEAVEDRQVPGNLPGGTETILLVEDEQSLRVLVRNVLTRLGYRVLEATTGNTAIAVWREQRHEIKLLLTDLVMPDGMTGKQLAEALLKEDPNLKVIYSSGYSRDIAGQGFVLQDGVNFLSKPFQAAKLAQTVRNSLDG